MAMRQRFWPPLMVATVLIAVLVAGAMVGAISPWRSPLTEALGQVSAVFDSGTNAKLEPATSEHDPDVEFSEVLSELPSPPTHLAVDAKNGDLWFVLFNYDGKTNDLYRYSTSTETVEIRPIPASTGSEFFSAIAVDSRGHVISAEGDVVLDIDPAGDYRELRLPAPANIAKQPGWEGTYVIDMGVLENKAYLTRMNTAAITELDLSTGSTREMAVPPGSGQMYFIEPVSDSIWMTSWVDTATAPSQTAILDLMTGKTESTTLQTSALAADSGGRMYISRTGSSGLSRVDSEARAANSVQGDWKVLGQGLDYLAVDQGGTSVWMAGDSSGAIMSLNSSTGESAYYDLPSWDKTTRISVPIACQIQACPSPQGAVTRLGGIAVAPNGDVFFSDMTFNRIGIVHAR